MTAEAPDTPLAGIPLLHQAVKELGWATEIKPPFEHMKVTPVEHRDSVYAAKAARWCHKALDGKTSDLAAMLPETGRNNALNNAGIQLYRYVLAGHLDSVDVTERLREAALTCGLSNGAIEATLQSAQNGAQKYGPQEPPLDPPTIGAEQQGPAPFDMPGVTVDESTGEIVASTDDEAAELSRIIRKNLPCLDWHELWADQSEEEWIVEPILPARRLVALYSAPKLGKSLLLLELCCAIATGRDVLGVAIDRPRRVLYVDFENDPKSDIRERLQAMSYGPDDLERLHYLSFPTLAALDSERGGQELMAAVAEYQCEVVVVDTVSRAVAGEENENDTWLAFYRHTGLKMKQAGVALIRLDHSGKDETKGQRGGSAKSGDVDAVWRLSRVGDGETFRLDCEAARMPIAEKTLVLHREVAPLRHRVDAEGRSAAFRIQVEQARAALDTVGVPLDMGRDKARAELKKHGYKAANGPLSEALQKRRNLSADRSAEWLD